MNFMTTFAHAGHQHAETSGDGSLGLMFGIGAVVLVVVAAVLIFLSRRQRKPAPAKQPSASDDETNGV